MSHREKLSARMTLSMPPSLVKALEIRAKQMNLDTPTLARAALAAVAHQGLSLGMPSNKEVARELEAA